MSCFAENKIWNVFFAISSVCILVTILLIFSCYKKTKDLSKLVSIILVGIVCAGFFGILPSNVSLMDYSSNKIIGVFETIGITFVNVMQMFSTDLDSKDLLQSINEVPFAFKEEYLFMMSFLCTIAPIMLVGAVISIFLSLSSKFRYILNFYRDIYIFSDLNERSLVLATDIKKSNKRATVVFTDVIEKDDELFYDLSSRAKKIGSIVFKEDISALNLKFHNKKTEMVFFIIGNDESENINQTLKLIDVYRERENTRVYVFSSSQESELALSCIDKGKIKAIRVKEVQSLIYNTLYHKGKSLFDGALIDGQEKKINAYVLGLGSYGTEMVKALTWYCQMDGYKLTINAFDKNEDAEGFFTAKCPDLMNSQYNGKIISGESYYKIVINSNVDINSCEFVEMIKNLEVATYIFVALGSDEENIKAATYIKMLCDRLGFNPTIHCVVYNSFVAEALKDVKNFKGQKYEIDFIGDVKITYSRDVIMNSEMEKAALRRHKKWGTEESFWGFEYNYRSSIASVIHKKAKDDCGHPENIKLNAEGKDALSPHEIDVLRELEHKRWNAWVRGEGYIFANERNDMAKTHYLLKSYDLLTIEEKEKDEVW